MALGNAAERRGVAERNSRELLADDRLLKSWPEVFDRKLVKELTDW
jgi:hypothetical protein